MDEFRIEISEALVPDLIEGERNILDFIRSQRRRMMEDFGTSFGKVHVVDTPHLTGSEYIILAKEQRVSEGRLETEDKVAEMNEHIAAIITASPL